MPLRIPDRLPAIDALLCGAVIFFGRTATGGFTGAEGSWWILLFCLSAGFLGVFYSAPPLKLAYRGLGEPVIGLIFGPLLMLGVYYSACGDMDASVLWISLPFGSIRTASSRRTATRSRTR